MIFIAVTPVTLLTTWRHGTWSRFERPMAPIPEEKAGRPARGSPRCAQSVSPDRLRPGISRLRPRVGELEQAIARFLPYNCAVSTSTQILRDFEKARPDKPHRLANLVGACFEQDGPEGDVMGVLHVDSLRRDVWR